MACKRRRIPLATRSFLGCATSSQGKHASQGQTSNCWDGRHLENSMAHRLQGVDEPTPPTQLQSPPEGSCHQSWVGFRLGNPKRVRHHNAPEAPFCRHQSRERCVVWCSYLETQSPKLGCDVLAAAALQPGDKRSDQNKKSKNRWCFNKKTRWVFPGCPVKQHRPGPGGVMDAAGRSGFRPALPLADPCPARPSPSSASGIRPRVVRRPPAGSQCPESR